MHGYKGKYIWVDLTGQEMESILLDLPLLKKYIGGMGVNLKLMEQYGRPRLDEYSPENPIVIGSGPLVGTLAPCSCKTFVTTKFPLSHCVSTAVGGMNFARQLKRAGFDHVVITGQAERPLYLLIEDDQVSFRNADELWGLDIYETTTKLRHRHGPDCSVIAIGQAGENLVKISLALIDYIASLGKGGLAAVMGSKRLKAVVAIGHHGINLADPQGFLEIADRLAQEMMRSPIREKMMTLGSMAGWQHWSEVAGIPYKDWSEIFPRKRLRENFGPEAFMSGVSTTKIACPSCYMPCKEIYRYTGDDEAEGLTYASSFIGRVTAFGARCDVGTIPAALACHELCSRMGIGTYSVSAAIDYLVTLFEDGVIGQDETEGLVLSRDFATTKILIEQIGLREGVGAKLADGFEDLGAIFGREFESKIKGTDFIFDPRNYRLGTYEFGEVVNPRGGHQHAGGSPTYGAREVPLEQMKKYCQAMAVSETEQQRIFYSEDDFNVARLTKHCEEYYTAFSLLGVCSRKINKAFYSMDIFSRLYSCATGMDINARALKKAGERTWNLLKILNVAEGFGREQDSFPAHWLDPMKDGQESLVLQDYYGKKQLNREDLESLLDDYYDERGWSASKGTPTHETVKKFDLEDEWQDLKPKCDQPIIGGN